MFWFSLTVLGVIVVIFVVACAVAVVMAQVTGAKAPEDDD